MRYRHSSTYAVTGLPWATRWSFGRNRCHPYGKSQTCPFENSQRAAERALCPFLQLEADQMAATKSHSLLQTIHVRRSTSGPGEARTRVTARSHPRISWNQTLPRGLQASYSYVAKEGLPKTVSLIHCSCWRWPRGSLTTPFFSYTDHFEYGKKC